MKKYIANITVGPKVFTWPVEAETPEAAEQEARDRALKSGFYCDSVTVEEA